MLSAKAGNELSIFVDEAKSRMTTFQLKSSVSASAYRGVIQGRTLQGGNLVMKGCVATAFLFVGLMIFGIL
jgi:hypothetical protein